MTLSTYRAQQLASLLVDPDPNLRLGASWSLLAEGFGNGYDFTEIIRNNSRWWITDPQLHDEIENFLNVELNKAEARTERTYFNGLVSINLFLSLLSVIVLCLLTRFVSMVVVVPTVIDLILLVRLAIQLYENT